MVGPWSRIAPDYPLAPPFLRSSTSHRGTSTRLPISHSLDFSLSSRRRISHGTQHNGSALSSRTPRAPQRNGRSHRRVAAPRDRCAATRLKGTLFASMRRAGCGCFSCCTSFAISYSPVPSLGLVGFSFLGAWFLSHLYLMRTIGMSSMLICKGDGKLNLLLNTTAFARWQSLVFHMHPVKVVSFALVQHVLSRVCWHHLATKACSPISKVYAARSNA